MTACHHTKNALFVINYLFVPWSKQMFGGLVATLLKEQFSSSRQNASAQKAKCAYNNA
jgi:hypothetical protein